MTTGMLHLHSVLRYLIVIVAVWAIFQSLSGMNGKKVFTKTDKRPGMLFMIFMDLQFVVGLVLWLSGAWGLKLIENMGGEVMKNAVARFFVMEHTIGMLLALVLVHLGYAASKKASNSDASKFKKSFWYYLIGFIVILAFVPWPFRAELGRGWIPGM